MIKHFRIKFAELQQLLILNVLFGINLNRKGFCHEHLGLGHIIWLSSIFRFSFCEKNLNPLFCVQEWNCCGYPKVSCTPTEDPDHVFQLVR